MAEPAAPVRGYSFTSFQTANPTAPIPASQLDTEIDRTNAAVGQLIDHVGISIRDDGTLAAGSVGQDQLQPDVFDGVVLPAEQRTNAKAAEAANSAAAAELARDQAQSFSVQAQSSATNTQANANTAASAAQTAQTLRDEAFSFRNTAETQANLATTARNDSQTAANNARNDRDLARRWASDLAGPVDDGLYSARFYAISVLGYDPGTPGAPATLASQVAFSPAGNLSSVNVQAAIQELDTEKAPTAHTHDAGAINSGTIALARLPVAPSGTSNNTQVVRADDARLSNARAPTAHGHAIADVTNLQTSLDAKANLASPNFTGTPQVGGQPVFHAGNFTPGNYALLAGANFTALSVGGQAVWHGGNFDPNSRQRIMAGATALANNANIPNTNSGSLYFMDLASGVQIVNLPNVTGLPDGFSCVINTAGDPSGFQTASVRAEVGRVIRYRGQANRDFFLIGRGETFRFTWVLGFGLWVAECLEQPQPFTATRTHSLAAWNSSPTSWSALAATTNTTVLAATQAQFTGSAFQVAATGVYQIGGSVQFSAGAGGGVTGSGFISAGNAGGVTTAFGFSGQQYNVGTGDSGHLNMRWSEALFPGDVRTPYIIASTAGLYYFLSSTQVSINLLTR